MRNFAVTAPGPENATAAAGSENACFSHGLRPSRGVAAVPVCGVGLGPGLVLADAF